MEIIIGTQHKDLFEEILPNLKIEHRSENTSSIRITQARFEFLVKKIRDMGYNPYTIMLW